MPKLRLLPPLLIAAALVAPALLPTPAVGQSYPQRPVRLIVTFPPGGGTDLLARIAAEMKSAGRLVADAGLEKN